MVADKTAETQILADSNDPKGFYVSMKAVCGQEWTTQNNY